MSISKPLSKSCCAALCLSLSASVWAQTPASEVSAEIRRTTFGVPHIRAADERGLGYGIGYAYAQDNLCLLPLLIHNGEPRSALVIGFGTGITAGALLSYPALEHRVVPSCKPMCG